MEMRKSYTGAAHDSTIINRIMLRFRPIAPKPVAEGSAAASVSANQLRPKRRYVRVKKSAKSKMAKEEVKKRDLSFDGAVGGVVSGSKVAAVEKGAASTMLSFVPEEKKYADGRAITFVFPDKLDPGPERRVVESWMVMEGLTGTWLDGGVLGNTDAERMRNLEADTCPGLISDGEHRVQWTNQAYKGMVDDGGEAPAEVVVWLVVKEKIPEVWRVFTCSARVVYTWRKEKHTQTMPCDVWKMDFGGFAWRLDANAALKLGL